MLMLFFMLLCKPALMGRKPTKGAKLTLYLSDLCRYVILAWHAQLILTTIILVSLLSMLRLDGTEHQRLCLIPKGTARPLTSGLSDVFLQKCYQTGLCFLASTVSLTQEYFIILQFNYHAFQFYMNKNWFFKTFNEKKL